jgi:hypothetical protein
MICAQVHTQCHKSCAHYTLGACYLYFKRNAEKFGVRVIRKVRAIGRKIRYYVIGSVLFFLGGRKGTRTPKHFVNLKGESKNFS